MTDKFLIAKADFRPVSPRHRQEPGRIKGIPCRFYIDKFTEHREAYEFVQEMQDQYKEGAKTVVRSLVHYRDTVSEPLSQIDLTDRSNIPEELMFSQLDFSNIPVAQREMPGRVHNMTVRLYIDKFLEHRWAYEFIQKQQNLFGEGNKTIVRALLHYRDDIISPMKNEEN